VSDHLLTARELAEYLGLRPGTVLDKWERGELPGFKFGRAVRFDLDVVLATGRQGRREREAPSNPSQRPGEASMGLAKQPHRREPHA
jgi:excisionase family DNA binding protein